MRTPPGHDVWEFDGQKAGNSSVQSGATSIGKPAIPRRAKIPATTTELSPNRHYLFFGWPEKASGMRPPDLPGIGICRTTWGLSHLCATGLPLIARCASRLLPDKEIVAVGKRAALDA